MTIKERVIGSLRQINLWRGEASLKTTEPEDMFVVLNPEILKREKKGEGPFVYEVLDRGKGNVPGHRFISVTELDPEVKRAMLEAAATARHEESAADSIVEMKFNKACQLALQNFSVDIGRFKRKAIRARRTDSWENIDPWLNALKPEE